MSSEPTSAVSPLLSIPDGRDPAAAWAFIRDHLQKPFSNKNVHTNQEYIECYTAVVNVLNVAKSQRTTRDIEVLYSNIRVFLHDSIQEGVEPIGFSTSEEIVAFYISSWEKFQALTKHNGRMLQYITRHYVNRVRDEGTKNVYPIEKLHAVYWKEVVFDGFEDELRKWFRDSEIDKDKKALREKLEECYKGLEEELSGTNITIPSFDDFSKEA